MTGKKTRKRASEVEINLRIRQALSMRARGHSDHQIVASLVQSEGLSVRQAERYVAEVKQIISAFGAMGTEEERGLVLKRLEILFSEAVSGDSKDIALANAILNNCIKVMALNLKHRVVKGGISDVHGTSASGPGLSPELAAALRRFESIETTEQPENG